VNGRSSRERSLEGLQRHQRKIRLKMKRSVERIQQLGIDTSKGRVHKTLVFFSAVRKKTQESEKCSPEELFFWPGTPFIIIRASRILSVPAREDPSYIYRI
jgi:hypothetical protein